MLTIRCLLLATLLHLGVDANLPLHLGKLPFPTRRPLRIPFRRVPRAPQLQRRTSTTKRRCAPPRVPARDCGERRAQQAVRRRRRGEESLCGAACCLVADGSKERACQSSSWCRHGLLFVSLAPRENFSFSKSGKEESHSIIVMKVPAVVNWRDAKVVQIPGLLENAWRALSNMTLVMHLHGSRRGGSNYSY